MSGLRLPRATWLDGTPVAGTGTYARLGGAGGLKPEDFVAYAPEAVMRAPPVVGGKSAPKKRALMEAKVRLKEAGAARRRRQRDAEEEARTLYDDLLDEGTPAVACEEVASEADDNESRIFWGDVGAVTAAEVMFRNCAGTPKRYANTGPKRSRLDRLIGKSS